MITYPASQKLNPFRAVDWRWRRAEELVASGRYFCKRRDDEATGEAVRYLRALQRCTNESQQSRLKDKAPTIAEAHSLCVGGGTRALLVQARLLARQGSSVIARRVGISPSAVDIYEQLFFNVRDRLDARYFIQQQALVTSRTSGTEQHRVAVAIKSMAFYGGKFVVDLAEEALFGKAAVPGEPGRQKRQDHRTAKIRMLATLLTLPFDKNSLKLLGAYVDLLNTTQMGSVSSDSPFASVSELLNEDGVDILDRYVIEGTVETDSVTNACVPETESGEAA